MPPFARTAGHKRLLAKIEQLFQRAEERGNEPCEYIERGDKETVAVCRKDRKVIVVVGNIATPSSQLVKACNVINYMMNMDGERYFVVQYYEDEATNTASQEVEWGSSF